MYGSLALTSKSIRDYDEVVGPSTVEELRELARPLRGLRVLNLSVMALGTRVGDMLASAVPLFVDLDLDCAWQVVRPTAEFSQVIQAMYHALAGGPLVWNAALNEVWERYEAMNAELLTDSFDVVIVHDPQLAAIRSFAQGGKSDQARWLLDCHLDLTHANEDVWLLLRSHIDRYDRVIFESPLFVRSDLRAPVQVIPPAIDPLAPRNMELSQETIQTLCARYAIDCTRPLIAQVAPFDEAHNPLAALAIFDLVREVVPDVQLLLIATLVPQTQVARTYFDQVATQAAARPDVHVLSELNYVGNVEINACQRASNVVFQAALHKGYGIHLAEASWKARPVVGPRSGGIPELIVDGRTGFLANTVEEAAERISTLLRDPDLAATFGAVGREYVRGQFLITRYLRDYLRLFQDITHGA